VPFAVAWAMGSIYNQALVSPRVSIPHKNSALAAGAVVAATYFSTLAIQRTSFPVVIMFESCSILPVVFVGVFCSRVHDPNLKLGPKKIVVALVIAAGILLFQFTDPETRQREASDEFIGIVFLLFHFVAEGFLPDLQAEIKINFKPRPTEMMADINKWAFIFTLALALVTLNAWSFLVFMWEHLEFTLYLLIMSVASGVGQFFVYRMIKQFKQHFVPFTSSSRKILTVAISILFYGHETNWKQITGISIVLFMVFLEFMTEITVKEESPETKDIIVELNEEKIDDNIKGEEPKGTNKETEEWKQGGTVGPELNQK
jgi:UDP-galactose transporter B1